MHVNKKFMSTYNKMHVHIQENACQHTFEISTYMSIKSTCQHTKHACQHFFRTCCLRKIACQHTAPFPDAHTHAPRTMTHTSHWSSPLRPPPRNLKLQRNEVRVSHFGPPRSPSACLRLSRTAAHVEHFLQTPR